MNCYQIITRVTSFFITCFLCCHISVAQDVPNSMIEQQFENMAEAENSETEDDSYQQQLQQLRRTPLNLNIATEADLQAFRWLSDLQVKSFIRYRELLGRLISIYELQAVPGWNLETIQLTRPFISVSDVSSLKEDAGRRIKSGDHTLLLRFGRVLEESKGYSSENDSTPPQYAGSPMKLFFRYKYQYKNLLQFGLVGEKDAGEQFFKGAQKYGFDFYSIHLFARNIGKVRRIAIGDFTVNFAQGLLTYQSLAFRKSSDVINIRRQTELFRPYNSSGEVNFQRGAAITIGSERWQFSAFGSLKKISANSLKDSLASQDYTSSISTSGYHRTGSEINNRNNLNQFSTGGRIQCRRRQLQTGLNAIYYSFSKPVQKDPVPYNQYAFSGKSLSATSIDYAYTFRNIHVFGEVAVDQKWSMANVHGLVASLDNRVDFSLLYRNIAKDYHSLNSNAFTENTSPINERGLYTGLSIRPWGTTRIDMYADVFSFPWLKYRVDRASNGSDYMVQVTWKPNKLVEVYTRLKAEKKAINYSGVDLAYHETVDIPKQNWRTQVSSKLSSSITLRARTEVVWFDRGGKIPEQGFLLFADVFYKPMMKPLALNIRLQYFETDSYNSRLYAYENDVLYSYSVPPFSGKGSRYYFNVNYDLSKNITTWFRFARSIFPGATSIGSGYDEIEANHKTDFRVQVLFRF